MHIADQIKELLLKDGWKMTNAEPVATFKKQFATGGQFGRVIKTLQIINGRWLERVDGWGTVEKDADLRNFSNNPQGAVDAVLTKK